MTNKNFMADTADYVVATHGFAVLRVTAARLPRRYE